MSTENAHRGLNYDDYAAIDDGQRYQVVEGELIVSPSPSTRHQRLVRSIARALDLHAVRTNSGEMFTAPFDVVLRSERPAIVLQPDVLFVSRDRAKLYLDDANIKGPPELVVEVLSPSNARLDTVRKSKLYAQYGVDECWFVANDFNRIEVWTRTNAGFYGFPQLFLPGQNLISRVLPGFDLSIGDLFAEADACGD